MLLVVFEISFEDEGAWESEEGDVPDAYEGPLEDEAEPGAEPAAALGNEEHGRARPQGRAARRRALHAQARGLLAGRAYFFRYVVLRTFFFPHFSEGRMR